MILNICAIVCTLIFVLDKWREFKDNNLLNSVLKKQESLLEDNAKYRAAKLKAAEPQAQVGSA